MSSMEARKEAYAELADTRRIYDEISEEYGAFCYSEEIPIYEAFMENIVEWQEMNDRFILTLNKILS